MNTLRFKSKVDTWFYLAIVSIPLMIMLPVMFTSSPEDDLVGLGITFVSLALPVWLLFTTDYTVTGASLFIRSGPFRWQLSLDEISGVKPSKSVLSAPALSLDRLQIEYGRNQSILVSPKNQHEFISALRLDSASDQTNPTQSEN